MRTSRARAFLFLLGLLVIFSFPITKAYADPPSQLPPGFFQIREAPGIQLYQKNYSGGSPDFVQVIDMGTGAGVVPLHGGVADAGLNRGVYGGADATFRSKTLGQYWRDFSSQSQTAFCVANGQFFYMKEYPTRLPFPLKVDGQLLTDGYALNEFTDRKLMLELWPDRVDIRPLTGDGLYGSTAPHIIAGLMADANKRADHYTGRTFVGVDDHDGDGVFETVLVFNTKTARQVDAAEVLTSFGADKVMMLDGGGSTQLLCEGDSLIYSERLVPQALGIFTAPEDGSLIRMFAESAAPGSDASEQNSPQTMVQAEPLQVQPEPEAVQAEPQEAQPEQTEPEPVQPVVAQGLENENPQAETASVEQAPVQQPQSQHAEVEEAPVQQQASAVVKAEPVPNVADASPAPVQQWKAVSEPAPGLDSKAYLPLTSNLAAVIVTEAMLAERELAVAMAAESAAEPQSAQPVLVQAETTPEQMAAGTSQRDILVIPIVMVPVALLVARVVIRQRGY